MEEKYTVLWVIMSLWDNLKNIFSKKDWADELIRIKSLSEQGDANAQNELGTMYQKGKGVKKNYAEAWKWYSLAIAQKHAEAADNRLSLGGKMTRAQDEEAQKILWAWVQNNFEKNKPAIEMRVKKIVNQHIKALSLKYKKTVYKDDYGNVFYDKWDKEIDYFIENMILADRSIDNLLCHGWHRNEQFRQICINTIKDMIG